MEMGWTWTVLAFSAQHKKGTNAKMDMRKSRKYYLNLLINLTNSIRKKNTPEL
jgi:hypothetical protein